MQEIPCSNCMELRGEMGTNETGTHVTRSRCSESQTDDSLNAMHTRLERLQDQLIIHRRDTYMHCASST